VGEADAGMSEEEIDKSRSGAPPWERPKMTALGLKPGERIALIDGSIREVVNNPGDGVWMIVKEIDDDSAGDEMVVITDIAGPV
jgi:hypothetical protein